MISAGGMYPIAFDVLSATGVLTHAATAALVITLPDGTTATPAITDTAVAGQYRLAYQSTIPGRYTAYFSTTGPVTSDDDEFDVAPTPWPAIISLADAKSQLNMDPAAHGKDDLLRDYLAGITGAIEDYKHEVIVRRSVTDEIDLCGSGGGYGYGWGRRTFRVWSAPVISLTSVVAWDASLTWDVTQMRVSAGGLVRVMAGMSVSGLVDVTYVAGYQQVPGRYRRGALVMLQHVWDTQRGAAPRTPLGGGGDDGRYRDYPGEFFTIPNRAKEWLGPPRPCVA